MVRISALVVAWTVLLAASPVGAQVVLDVSKLTCWQFATNKVANPERVAAWISGFYHGKRGDMLVDTEKLDKDTDRLKRFCLSNGDMPVMEAVETVVGTSE